MPRQNNSRPKLILAAQSLFHQKGIERSTLADVADASGVPLGNIYYYFRTKEELIVAVVENERQSLRELLTSLDRVSDPSRRLIRLTQSFNDSCDERAAHGCLWGNLCQEANKLGGPVAELAATLLETVSNWVASQFRELGCTPLRSRKNASHFLTVIQGASLLAQTFHDPKLFRGELTGLSNWLKSEMDRARNTPQRNGTQKRRAARTLPVSA